MTLFFSLLPLYLFGNLHCMGMCGPLVFLLGRHRYRYFYFFGRILSFSLAGYAAGEMGAILHLILKKYYLAEIVSLAGGTVMILWGMKKIIGIPMEYKIPQFSFFQSFQHWASKLMLKDSAWTTFLFGFFTVALPCGQSLIVFTACALTGNGLIGLANGFAFSVLTTPSLAIAMHTLNLFKKFKQYDQKILGYSSLLVGGLAFCRGLAEAGVISHLTFSPDILFPYHLVIF